MSTLIWYNVVRNDYCVLKTPELKWSGLSRAECITSNSLGITSEDLDRAEANPETWIACEQEEPSKDAENLQISIADLTEQRDALLTACRQALPMLRRARTAKAGRGMHCEYAQDNHIINWIESAIALAEPNKEGCDNVICPRCNHHLPELPHGYPCPHCCMPRVKETVVEESLLRYNKEGHLK